MNSGDKVKDRICYECGSVVKEDFQHHCLCEDCHIKINGTFFQKLIYKIKKKLNEKSK